MNKIYLKTLLVVLSIMHVKNALPQKSVVRGSKVIADTAWRTAIPLAANAYVYPNKESEEENSIDKKGLLNWNDATVFTRIFFYPQQAGKLFVAVKLKSADEGSKLSISLDSSGKTHEIKVHQSADLVEIPVGVFMINDSRYHYIEIKGSGKQGKYFPAIESIIISGDAAKNVKFNTSEYRGAASTHLRYESPRDSSIAWFYSEVNVPEGINAVNAYYETNGFADGYMGIQVNSASERRFIFSVWSNYKTDDPKQIPSDYAVTLLKKGNDVFSGEFGNEGSGGHSHLVFPWKNGTTYKLLVGAKPSGDHTIFTGYYYAPEKQAWQLIAQWDKTKTGGKLLSGLYAFVENFGGNGNDYFKARYGNQWVCTPAGTWMELTKCSFTTTANPVKHPRFDYGGGVENNWFYMFSGGFTQMNNLAPHAVINREPGGIAPNIDFVNLPDR